MSQEPVDIDAINAGTAYVLYAVFERVGSLPGNAAERADVVHTGVTALSGVSVRGWYDLAAFRAGADLLLWCHAESVEALQEAYHRLLACPFGEHLRPTWSAIGVHRPAEFNRAHVPAFLAGEAPGAYICLYPFVRSYDWFLLPPQDRSRMLREHGLAARDYADVRANTVASFGLGDYEFLLAFEAPAMHRIVDLMRDLRAVEARRHVREEIPFHAGVRVSLAEWADRQPRLSPR